MRRSIKKKLKPIVEVDVTVLDRHLPEHGATRLTCDLLKQFDELWVFGFGNDRNDGNNPFFELTDDEVYDLSAWMYRGGVLITGDHSQPPGAEQCESTTVPHEDFLARGFSLGRRIPRAGQLRVWQGPPTNCEAEPGQSDTYNTLGKVDPSSGKTPSEDDTFPQMLEKMQPPHLLFFYGLDDSGQPLQIEFLPDHQHEGRVITPDTFDRFWPPGPHDLKVAAKGSDQRFPDEPGRYKLVLAYDGDAEGVGRIVADSSFHHYLNLNLEFIPEKDASCNPVPHSPRDQIAQFYANLALWLAPAQLRAEIMRDMFFRAATHLNVFEALGNSAQVVGRAMTAALASSVGVANVLRVLEAVGDDEQRPAQLLKHALAGMGAHAEFDGVSVEFLLGETTRSYHRFFREQRFDPLNLREDPTPPGFLLESIENAFNAHLSAAGGPHPKPEDESEASGGEAPARTKEPADVVGEDGEV
jgi:hypothetical protein